MLFLHTRSVAKGSGPLVTRAAVASFARTASRSIHTQRQRFLAGANIRSSLGNVGVDSRLCALSIRARGFHSSLGLLYSDKHSNLPKDNEEDKPVQTLSVKASEVKNAPKSKIQDVKSATVRENIWTVPNVLTFTRLISAPIIGYLVVNEQPILALSLFTYSCVTDYVDGYIARKYKLQTVLGSVIDPMADKALMITLTCCLAQSGVMPIYLATLILGRDVLLGFSALYYRYISLPLPKTFSRFWDFGIPSAEVHPTTISKYNTALQMLYIGLAMIDPVLVQSIEPSTYETFATSMSYFGYLVGSTTVLSGLSYVGSNKAVKILNK